MAYDVRQTDAFGSWLDAITDDIARKAIVRRIVRISGGLFGDVKSLGDGVSEARVDVGQGYRLYYTIREQTVIFMLNGGIKSHQNRDLRKARDLAAEIP